jgi:tRNA (guanine37-N1)-methyltransferase
MLYINILTLFPQFFDSPLRTSILQKAQKKKLVNFNVINIRDFADDKHQITDEAPYGGGPGMIMKVEPIHKALQSINAQKGQQNKKILLTSAKGQKFSQSKAQSLSNLKELTIICGHYQDIDQRIVDHLVDEEISIGDYVMTGGEPAAIVISDAVTRLIPGVLGNENSLNQETHSSVNYKSYPHYTRPENYNNWSVPKVLLSGDHQKIEDWRKKHSS